jgi:release factor glutamine methyltransferase
MLHKPNTLNIKEVLKFGEIFLKNHSPSSRLDSEIILAFVLKVKKEFLYSNFEKNISKDCYQKFFKLINLRKKNIPISQITGIKEFYGNEYFVSKDTLIPRPETEELIENVKNIISKEFNSNKKITILEIGSGTGCIPITLKQIFKTKTSITSFEISKNAFSICIKNYKKIKPGKIIFKNNDAFSKNSVLKDYDSIISNPPYLDSNDMKNLQKEVKKEPKLALFGGNDGLRYYRKLYKLLKLNLRRNGIAFFEINQNLAKKTAAIFSKEFSCSIIKDSFLNDRFLIISHQL